MNLWHRIRKFVQQDLWTADLSALTPLGQLRIRILRLLVVAVWEFREGVLNLRALGLVYTTLLSLVPFLAVTFSVLKAFGAHYRVEPLLARALEPLGPKGAEITSQVVEFVSNLRVGVLGAVGLAGLFLTVISLLGKIEDALNHIWRVRRPRSLARKFTDYLSVVLVGPVLVFSAFGLIASAQSHWLVQRIVQVEPLGFIIVPLASRLMPFLFLCAAFTFLYKFIPQADVRVGSALLGGATAAVLWQLAGAGFAVFVAGSTRYTAIYSTFAVLILFLIWLYVGWLVVLVGGQVAYFHQHPSVYLAARRQQSFLSRERLALAALVEIARRHLSGEIPYRPLELATELNVPQSTLEELIDEFVRRGILLRTAEPRGVALGRPPERVSVVEILDLLRDPDSFDVGLPQEGEGSVASLLRLRDQVVRQALDGVTLRSLAVETPAPELTSPVLPVHP